MTIPFATVLPVDPTAIMYSALMTLVTGLMLTHKIFRWKADPIRNAPILIIFILSGLLWAVVMRHFVAFHNFQSIYYIGLPIAIFTLLGSYLNPKVAKITAVAGALLFIVNVRTTNQLKDLLAANVNERTQEFQAIDNHLPAQSTVFIDGDRSQLGIGFHAVDYYLIQTYLASPAIADYIISANPLYNQFRLTNNPHVNLFLNLSSASP